MGLSKCPRCELNYIKDNEKVCTVCKRDIRREVEPGDIELCTACGERPAVLGEDLCAYCTREIHRLEGLKAEEPVEVENPRDTLVASEMDEIEIEIDDDIPSSEMGEIDAELGTRDEIVPESLEQLEEEELNAVDDEEEM